MSRQPPPISQEKGRMQPLGSSGIWAVAGVTIQLAKSLQAVTHNLCHTPALVTLSSPAWYLGVECKSIKIGKIELNLA